MQFFNFFPLKIHCWGGLGSQLLALNYYFYLNKVYPKRKILLILHNSGITVRESEIDFLEEKIDIRKINDFFDKSNLSTETTMGKKFRPRKILFKCTKFILDCLGIIIYSEKKIRKIKTWTISIRCTYALNPITKEDLTNLATILEIPQIGNELNLIGVHFRAGDLLSLKSQSLINGEVIENLVNKINRASTNLNMVRIYSDSTSEELNFLFNFDQDLCVKNLKTLDTLIELLKYKTFIGTNSKISFWVLLFKWGLNISGTSYVPESIAVNFFKVTNFDSKNLNSFLIEDTRFVVIKI
jgi:hypothetical protein